MWAAMENTKSIPGRPTTARCDLEQCAVHLNKLDGIVTHLEELSSDETEFSWKYLLSSVGSRNEEGAEPMGRYLQMNTYIQCLG